jgi:hypothetical protein
VFEVIVGSADRERQGLAKRRLLRLLAPHTMENPIYFHLTNSSSEVFRKVHFYPTAGLVMTDDI